MKFNKEFINKTVVITGGTGSFGETLLQKALRLPFKEIRIFSRDEKKQEDLRLRLNSEKVKFYIGDVRNLDSLDYCFKNADYVFHAAALKQVPSCEFYPSEAILTNVYGSENVIKSAIKNNVIKLIMLSTDKAVYPLNTMGLTKSLMEKIMLANARNIHKKSPTVLCATRYGNVLGSRGSVIPLFLSQLKNNKPITVTDENMTRFLMTLEDSVDLVIHAFLNAKQGDIFVQKTDSAKIQTIIDALAMHFKVTPKIFKIGIRHGEKKHETLMTREERNRAVSEERYFRIPLDSRDLNYKPFTVTGEKTENEFEDYSSDKVKLLGVKETLSLFKKAKLFV